VVETDVARARLEVYLERATRRDIGVFFCTGKNSEVKIERVLILR
jgi:hypothetical protein